MKIMFFLSEKGFRKLFYTLLMFGKHRKFGQTKINFRVNRKITHLASKAISDFILPSDQLHSSQTLSKLSCDRAPQNKTHQMVSFHRLSSSPLTHTPENTHSKRESSSTLHLKNPSTSSPVRLPSLFKPILAGDAQNHPSTHGPLSHASHSAYPSLVLVLCRPIPILILTDPPPSTHPSFEPTHTFKSSFMD